MKLFKNFKTKKHLREEISFLKGMRQTPIMQVERNVMKVSSCVTIDEHNMGMPIEFAKKQIARNLTDKLEQFIQYDIQDGEYRECKVITGTLNIVIS